MAGSVGALDRGRAIRRLAALLVAASLLTVGNVTASEHAAYLPVIGNPAAAPAGCFTCAYDAYNCSDFPTQHPDETTQTDMHSFNNEEPPRVAGIRFVNLDKAYNVSTRGRQPIRGISG